MYVICSDTDNRISPEIYMSRVGDEIALILYQMSSGPGRNKGQRWGNYGQDGGDEKILDIHQLPMNFHQPPPASDFG